MAQPPMLDPATLEDFHRRRHLLLYVAAQEAITEMRCGTREAAERILLRAGVEDPDGPTEYEPDRNDED